MTVKLMLPEIITRLNKNHAELAEAMQHTRFELERLLDEYSSQAALFELRSGEEVALLYLTESEDLRLMYRFVAEDDLKQFEENQSGMPEEWRQRF